MGHLDKNIKKSLEFHIGAKEIQGPFGASVFCFFKAWPYWLLASSHHDAEPMLDAKCKQNLRAVEGPCGQTRRQTHHPPCSHCLSSWKSNTNYEPLSVPMPTSTCAKSISLSMQPECLLTPMMFPILEPARQNASHV